MVRQIASHSPAHQIKYPQPLAACVSSAAAFAPLATAGPQYGLRDVAKPKNLVPSATAGKAVPSTAAACEALERAAHSPEVNYSGANSRFSHPPIREESTPPRAAAALPVARPLPGPPAASAQAAWRSPPQHTATQLAPNASVRDAFDHFDANGSGFLDYHELYDALFTMGIDTSIAGAGEILRQYDDNSDGKMDFREFSQLVRELRGDPGHGIQPGLGYAQPPSPLRPSTVMVRDSIAERRERAESDAHAQAEENRAARRQQLVDGTRVGMLAQESPLRRLVELEALPLVIGSGHFAPVRLVRAEFLVELWQRGEALLPRQEMPEGAFFDGLPSRCEIVAVSCPWLTDMHPDPFGHHLGLVAPPLLSLIEEAGRRRHAPAGLASD